MAVHVHKEDIKALIRKRYGTLEAFQNHHGLTGQSVRDFLRGQSKTAKTVIAREFGVQAEHLRVDRTKSPLCGEKTNTSKAVGACHPVSPADCNPVDLNETDDATHRLSRAAE